ncbi:MAG TPA: FAD-dependent oxidoreductase [Phycisphaerae bacterium]|nr:FAD-dependent oxidoreductase [Phycisphaerae bacterium]
MQAAVLQAGGVREAEREVPVRAEYDVAVAGGGLGGVAAATAAARAGARTLLVERNGFPGGVATAGMCCSVFNCFYTADHRLGVTGIPVEVADALAEATGFGKKWHGHKGHVIYDVERAKLVLTELLASAGVEVLFDTVVAGAVADGDALKGIVVESKSGREAILAKVVVDATGDADVAHLAGAPVHTRPPWGRHSFVFRVGNVDVDAFVQYFVDHPDQYAEHMDVDWTFSEALEQYRGTGTFLFPHGGGFQMDIFRKAIEAGRYRETLGLHDTLPACQMHAIRDLGVVHIITGFADVEGLDVGRISRAMIDGRKMAFYVTGFFREHVPGFERACVIATADDLGIRASRWIDGEFVFTREMKQNPTRFDDAVGRGVVERDVKKNPAPNAWGVQTFTNDTFDVPCRALLPRKVENLIMGAGRSISAADPLLLRVMALTMVVGQGAGTAAAVAARSGATPRDVDVAAVQQELIRQGVTLG